MHGRCETPHAEGGVGVRRGEGGLGPEPVAAVRRGAGGQPVRALLNLAQPGLVALRLPLHPLVETEREDRRGTSQPVWNLTRRDVERPGLIHAINSLDVSF